MKTIWKSSLAVLLLASGCAVEWSGPKRTLAIGLPKPPTNAVVSVTYTKIGIIVDQSPTTQSPTLTLGYQRGAYFRIPAGYSNMFVAPFESSVTTETALGTKITEKTSTKSEKAETLK